MDGIGGVLTAVIPSVGVGLLFWFAMRAIMNADRTERQALARMDAEENAQQAARSAKNSQENGSNV
ncbi:hypothetical protein [Cellulomonas palmilytica]|uniref:hypothetical protein n=1 Tax=Cellulomonas palmilytica TaxID=2608402 RepID=UPI001F3EBB72|nr:hypothetical protein [Cellulomonas palmilytica]UJP40914.1 hypothetical protein F1D97_05445 [Cellulomonas palmilytica]